MSFPQLLSVAGFCMLALAACAVPLVTDDLYRINVATTIVQNLLLAMSLRLVMNLGLLNLAHISLMGIGAYISAALAMQLGMSFWITLPIAATTASLVALALGLLTLRMHGPYFFLVTFSLMAMTELFFHSYFVDVFGGATGLIGVPPPDPINISNFTLSLNGKISLYYLITTLWIIALVVLVRLDYSRLGLQYAAIKQSEAAARAIGIRTIQCKLVALALTGFMAGIVGVFFAHSRAVVHSGDFGIDPMLRLLVFAVIGGIGNIWGPVVGTIGMSIISEFLRSFHFLETLVYGVVLILAMRLFPQGVVGALGQLADTIDRWRVEYVTRGARP